MRRDDLHPRSAHVPLELRGGRLEARHLVSASAGVSVSVTVSMSVLGVWLWLGYA